MTLNYDDPVSSAFPLQGPVLKNYGRLSRPPLLVGQDEEMEDAPTTKEKSQLKDESSTKHSLESHVPTTLSSSADFQQFGTLNAGETTHQASGQSMTPTDPQNDAKPVQCRTAFTQLQSWISDQPPAQSRPLPKVTRMYTLHCAHKRGGLGILAQQKFDEISKDKMTTETTPSTPACLLPPPCYPEEPLDYD